MRYSIPKPFRYADGVIWDQDSQPVMEIRTDNSHSANELAFLARLAVIGMNDVEIVNNHEDAGPGVVIVKMG